MRRLDWQSRKLASDGLMDIGWEMMRVFVKLQKVVGSPLMPEMVERWIRVVLLEGTDSVGMKRRKSGRRRSRGLWYGWHEIYMVK